jgi:uncharacterized membrane protein
MLWLIYSLLAAMFTAVQSVFNKKALKEADEYTVSFFYTLFAALFVAPLVYYYGIPELKPGFVMILIISGLLNAFSIILFIRAIKISDLSITMPILAFSPIFLLITSPLIVGEFPSPFGLIGVIFVVVGSYVLNISKLKDGFFEPFKALVKDKGARLMFFVALIWSITANLDKVGIFKSSSLFWTFALFIITILLLLPFVIIRFLRDRSRIKTTIFQNVPLFAAVGLFEVLIMLFQYAALKLTLVSYMISVKRTSAIFSVILGFIIFKEKGFKERLLGVSIMVFGVIIIAFS